jgi:hypothetical protein
MGTTTAAMLAGALRARHIGTYQTAWEGPGMFFHKLCTRKKKKVTADGGGGGVGGGGGGGGPLDAFGGHILALTGARDAREEKAAERREEQRREERQQQQQFQIAMLAAVAGRAPAAGQGAAGQGAAVAAVARGPDLGAPVVKQLIAPFPRASNRDRDEAKWPHGTLRANAVITTYPDAEIVNSNRGKYVYARSLLGAQFVYGFVRSSLLRDLADSASTA